MLTTLNVVGQGEGNFSVIVRDLSGMPLSYEMAGGPMGKDDKLIRNVGRGKWLKL
jgi:hypothetical protein